MAENNNSLSTMLSNTNVKKRFEELLGKKSAGFISTMLSVVRSNALLAQADPNTIISAGAMAAALDLPVNPSLGLAYIVPYRDNKANKVLAQFQLGYKGFIQLAMRSGAYQTIHATEVYEGEISSVNRLTGALAFGEKTSDTIVGYCAYFKLNTGYEKFLYMSLDEVKAHGNKFSKSYNHASGLWNKDLHSMAIKTVIKRLLSKYGILSIEQQGMSTALIADQAVIGSDNTMEYIDTTAIADEPETLEIEIPENLPEVFEEAPKTIDPGF